MVDVSTMDGTASRPRGGGRGRRRHRRWAAIVAVTCLAGAAACSSDTIDGAASTGATSTTAEATSAEANDLIGPDGRFAFPAPRLATQLAFEPDGSGGAAATFSVAYAVAHPAPTDGAAADEATISLQVARAMNSTGPQPTDLVFTTTKTDDGLDAAEVTRDYAIDLPADAYQFLLDQGLGSDEAEERAAAQRLVSVGVQQARDYRVVDGDLDWIHGAAFDATMSPTAPSDNPGGAVTVINDTATGIYAYDWDEYSEPVPQEYGANLVPEPQGASLASSSSEGVSIALAGQAVSCLYQGTDGSNPSGFTTTLAPNAAVTQTIVADDKSTDQPANASDTAEVSQAVIEAIDASLKAVAAVTEAGFSAPFTLIVQMADLVFGLGTGCNNQPNVFQLSAVTQDGQGTNSTAWAIWDGCGGTCGGLANVYSSPWESSAPNEDAQMATQGVQLAPSTVTYEGEPLWLAQMPTGDGCGVGDGSSSNTSGCTSQNVISLRWITQAPCPWTNGMAIANGSGGIDGGSSWCFQDPPTSPSIPACGTNNADCVAYDPES